MTRYEEDIQRKIQIQRQYHSGASIEQLVKMHSLSMRDIRNICNHHWRDKAAMEEAEASSAAFGSVVGMD